MYMHTHAVVSYCMYIHLHPHIVYTLVCLLSLFSIYYTFFCCVLCCRHPDSHSRPSFPSLCQTLAEEAGSLLELIEPNDQDPSQASLLGAPLQAGAELYLELQKTYQ